MAEEEKMIPIGETHETPQAITITIMDPSALGTPNIASSIVTSVEPQKTTGSSTSGNCNLLMVSSSGEQEPKSSILQTVTETHMGTEELPIISSISNPDHDESAELETKISQTLEGMEGEMAQEGPNEPVGQHCLICNIDIEPNEVEEDEEEQQQVPVFKSLTTSTNRRISIFLGGLVGQKLTSRKAHSDIMCRRCFNLLDRVDSLEVEIKETKEEIVNKYQETLTVHGGRARRKKPSTARKSEYVFPKVEPEDEDDQMLGLETDGTFEPRLEDLIEEEHDRREDVNPDDDEWEPEFKRTRIKREIDMDSGVPPKRKRGRPRKDATRPKELEGDNSGETSEVRKNSPEEEESHLCRPGSIKTKTCQFCQEEVPIINLMNHLDGHANQVDIHENQKYFCPFCQHTSTRLVLSRHLQDEHPLCFLPCEVCPLKFLDSQAFKNHQLSHTNGQYTCNVCSINFGTPDELSNHRNSLHTEEKESYSCPMCNTNYRQRSLFVSHVVKYHKGLVNIEGIAWGSRGSLVCSVCQKRFKKASLFLTHEKAHRSNRFACHYCQNTYPTPVLLQDHIITHQFGDYECTACSIKFASLNQLTIHEEKVHKTPPAKICEYCNKEFRDQLSLICHRRKTHPESEESQKAKYSCSECGMRFMVWGNLVKHLRMHSKKKDAKVCACAICGKVLSNKYSLATHMKTHSRDNTFKCNACEKAFVTKYTLLDHMRRIHEEFDQVRDKACHICGRTFFTNAELKYHIKTHTGERPFKCKICKESYLSSSTLRYHMQKHSNVMFVCQDCQAKFKNYVGWSAHMKRVHGVSCVKEYTKQHGILQAVKKDEPSLYIIHEGHNRVISNDQTIAAGNELERIENSATLGAGLEENASTSGKDVENIIQIVSFEDLKNPLVHTVDAYDAGMSNSRDEETEISITNSSITTSNLPQDTVIDAGAMEAVTETSYSQANERSKMMITEEWELMLATDTEETQVMTEEWEGAQIVVQPGTILQDESGEILTLMEVSSP